MAVSIARALAAARGSPAPARSSQSMPLFTPTPMAPTSANRASRGRGTSLSRSSHLLTVDYSSRSWYSSAYSTRSA